MAADIQHLADEIQPRAFQRFHRLRRHLAGIHAAQGHLGGAVALGAGGHQLPVGQLRGNCLEFARRVLLHRLGSEPAVGQQPGHLLGEQLGEQGLQLAVRPFALLLGQPLGQVDMRQQVDMHAVARLPERGNLQDRRAAEAAVGEQDVLAKALAVAADQAILHRGAGQLGAQRLQLRVGNSEGHQPGAGRQQGMAELPRHLVAEAAGAEGRDRQAAGGNHQGCATDQAGAGLQLVTGLEPGDLAD
ncbi:hypothetical protein D3C85_554990 [compost metagenome]